MSSILKALKKIEESAPAGPIPGQTDSVEPRSVFRSRLREKKAVSRGLFYAATAAGVVLAVLLAYRFLYEDSPPANETPDTGAAKAVRGKMPPAGPAPGMAAPVAEPARAAVPQPPAQVPPASAPPAPAPDPNSQPAKPMRARGRAVPPAPPREERPFVARKEPPPPPAEGAVAARPAPARSAEDALDRLDDSKLQVMAIAWSQDPARRIAVVNGRIVKEGESVDGYSVSRIRKDDVVVSDGGKSWRAVLNLKTQP